MHGAVVVRDAEGREHRVEDGSLTVRFHEADELRELVVPVENGRWRIRLPPARQPEVLFLGAVLGKKTALFADEIPLVPGDDPLELSTRWPAATLVHVKDKHGLELENVLVLQVHEGTNPPPQHPGRGAASALDPGPSPFEVPPAENCAGARRTVYVTSPGYAWSSTQVDLGTGGEHELVLHEGAALELDILGCAGPESGCITATTVTGMVEFELADQLITGLDPGYYHFTAHDAKLGPGYALGRNHADAVEGATTLVALPIRTAPQAKIPIAGVVVVPSEWGLDSFELRLQSTQRHEDDDYAYFSLSSSAMTLLDARRGEYRWSVPAAPPGGYTASIPELTVTATFTACSPRLDDVRIVAPPPCEILVYCVDAQTREILPEVRVLWNLGRAAGVDGGNLLEARWESGLAAHRILAPSGTIRIQSKLGRGYGSVHRSVAAGPGRTELTLELPPQGGLRVTTREGDRAGPPLGLHALRLVQASGALASYSLDSVRGAYLLCPTKPGLYCLQVTAPEGYAPWPDVTVRIEDGVVREHVVELVRLP